MSVNELSFVLSELNRRSNPLICENENRLKTPAMAEAMSAKLRVCLGWAEKTCLIVKNLSHNFCARNIKAL